MQGTRGRAPAAGARGRLKRAGRRSDSLLVATPELSCPICNADLPLAGDEKVGEDIYCTYCGAPCVLRGKPSDPESWEAEEDF